MAAGRPTLIVCGRVLIWHFTPLSLGEGQGGEAEGLGVRLRGKGVRLLLFAFSCYYFFDLVEFVKRFDGCEVVDVQSEDLVTHL